MFTRAFRSTAAVGSIGASLIGALSDTGAGSGITEAGATAETASATRFSGTLLRGATGLDGTDDDTATRVSSETTLDASTDSSSIIREGVLDAVVETTVRGCVGTGIFVTTAKNTTAKSAAAMFR